MATIHDIDFDPILRTLYADPQGTISNIYALILAAQEFHQPLRTIKACADKEWMTSSIKSLIRQREKARLIDKNETKARELAHRITVAIKKRKT